MFVSQLGTRSAKATYSRFPDWPEMAVWDHYLGSSSQGVGIFVDVGANAGLYTVLAAEHGFSVIAVEPVEDAVRLLEANAALNDIDLQLFSGIVNRDGSSAFLSAEMDSRTHVIGEAVGNGKVGVKATTLDALIGDRMVVGMKMDIEGFEEEALRGATATLERQGVGLLQLEWNDLSERTLGNTRVPIVEMLVEAGYIVARPGRDGRLKPISVGQAGPYGRDLFAFSSSVSGRVLGNA